MVIIRKKRIWMIAACFFISLGVFGLQQVMINKTQEVVALPSSSKIVIIDAGHRPEKI